MKKLLLLLLTAPLFVFTQTQVANPVTKVLILPCQDYIQIESAITVPEGKFWTINSTSPDWVFTIPNSQLVYGIGAESILPSGSKIFYSNVNTNCNVNVKSILTALEYSYDSAQGLSYNDVEKLKDRINLFPNPTSSLLALNSDKEYDIEVFDMAGNKVMALTGNSINMEHLSTATYIVKATDKSNNEELTYKVVKN